MILQIISILFTLLISSTLLLGNQQAEEPWMVSDGELNLSRWDFSQQGAVALKGDWLFQWENIPNQPPSAHKWQKIKIPGHWKQLEKSVDGSAWYLINIQLPKNIQNKNLGLLLPPITSAYTLYINNKKVFNTGDGIDNYKNHQPSMGKVLLPLPKLELEEFINLKIHIWTYGLADQRIWGVSGGFSENIYLGPIHQLKWKLILHQGIHFILLGIIIMMGIYHLILWLQRQQSREYLYLSMTCFFALIPFMRDFLVETEFFTLYPHMVPWSIAHFLSVNLIYISWIYFLCSLFPDQFTKSFKLASIPFFYGIGEGLISIVYYQITDKFLYLPFTSVMLVGATLITISIVFYKLFYTYTQKQEGVVLLIVGIAVGALATLHDALVLEQVFENIKLSAYGLVFLLFCQAFLLAHRFSKAFQASEQLNESLCEMNQLKDEFLANTSHELRTPLNGIIGLAESMLSDTISTPPEIAKQNLNMIVLSGRRLSALVDDILDMAKIRKNELTITLTQVDIFSHVEMASLVIRPILKDKPIKLINQVHQQTPPIMSDENRFQQILINLLGNAAKFTESGTIEVTTKSLTDGVEIAIKDTGPGIPDGMLDTIFEPFKQVDGSAARQFGGTGLGLSITQELIHLQKGTLRVDSSEGQGSTFFVTLPLYDEKEVTSPKNVTEQYSRFSQNIVNVQPKEYIYQDDVASTIDSQKVLQQFNGTKESILIVDDDPINVQVLINHLSPHNYEIRFASNGETALDEINNAVPDLILLDVMMPKMTGFHVLKVLREKYPGHQLPVIMLTAKTQVKDLVHGFTTGVNDYITKPFEKSEVLARVHSSLKILEQARTENELLTAQAVQDSLIPDLKLTHDTMELVSFYKPTGRIGGDWFDYFVEKDILHVIIGDVTGHGIPAALLTAVAKGVSDCVRISFPDIGPGQFLNILNQIVSEISNNLLNMTMFYLQINLKTGESINASAGHHPALILNDHNKKKNFVPRIPTQINNPLGLSSTTVYEETSFSIPPKTLITLYTDGIIECTNPEMQEFGQRRFNSILNNSYKNPVAEISEEIQQKAASFYKQQYPVDDISFILLRCKDFPVTH